MNISIKNHNEFLVLFIVMIASSSIVMIEPAPYDLLFLLLLCLSIFCRWIVYETIHFWPVACLLLFTLTNLFSLFFVNDFSSASIYFLITLYCIILWGGMVGFVTHFGVDLLSYTFYSYVAAAFIVVVPSVIAYSNPGTVLDLFLWGERVQGLFKDPNVFGPFLIPPSLFALWKMGGQYQRVAGIVFWMTLFLLLTIGILLSFSRAAWGQFILAIGMYLVLINRAQTRRMRTLFILTIVFVPVLIYCVMATDISHLFFERMKLQGYDQTRFQVQGNSLEYMLIYPLGFGPGQSEFMLQQSTHNLFIRVISENGLLGLLSFSLFFVMTIGRSIYVSTVASLASKGFFDIITASLIGILFNSMFIDTMHWRHFWLLLALPWIPIRR